MKVGVAERFSAGTIRTICPCSIGRGIKVTESRSRRRDAYHSETRITSYKRTLLDVLLLDVSQRMRALVLLDCDAHA